MNNQTFFNICTEKELFAFIEHQTVILMEESDRAGPEWAKQERQELKNAIAHTTRFGVEQPIINNQATEAYWIWFDSLKNWWANLSDIDVIEYLKRLPWNREENEIS